MPNSTTSINYQGRLLDQDSGDAIDAQVNLSFTIFNAATELLDESQQQSN